MVMPLVMLPVPVIQKTIELLEETQWTYDGGGSGGGGRAMLYCRSCGASASSSSPTSDSVATPKKHKSGCELDGTIQTLKASLPPDCL